MRFKSTEIATFVVAAIAFVGAIVSAFYTYNNRNRELDIELVKIGIGILRADPKEAQTEGAREWAIQVIEKYSRQPFSASAKNELLKSKLDFGSSYYDSSFLGGGGDYPNHRPPPAKPTPQR